MPENMTEEKSTPGAIHLFAYGAVLLKRKWTLAAFALPLIMTVTVLSFTIKPIYTAKGTLLIEKEPNTLSFEKFFQIEYFNEDYYQTQYKLLKSRALAEATIEKLRLYENAKFAGKLMAGDGATKKPDATFRRKLTDSFLKRLVISPVRQTRLVEVHFKDHDPGLAAEILNAFFESFIAMNIQFRFQTREQDAEFLAAQIATLRSDIAERERELQQYGADKNIVSLSDKETTIVEKLGEFNRALTEAQIDRVKKETYYKMVQGVSPDSIPEALNNALIQRLREEYGRLSREYTIMEGRFGPEYPEMQRVKTELEGSKKSLAAELANLQKAAHSDWQAALQKERSLESVFNSQKQEAFQLNSNSILYNSIKIDIENKKSVLETLQTRQNETVLSAELKGMGTSNVRIVDRAEPPLYPSSPRKKLNIALAMLIGLIGGMGLAFLFEHLDDSIKHFDDIERYTGWPSLGAIPAFGPSGSPWAHWRGRERKRSRKPQGLKIKVENRPPHDDIFNYRPARSRRVAHAASAHGNRPALRTGSDFDTEGRSIELITFTSPLSGYSESYRSIRTSVLIPPAAPSAKCIAVSSPLPQEGKTTTLSNLAVTLSQAGKKVLIVDSDLRKPRLHTVFGMPNSNDGLSSYLTGAMELEGLIKPTPVPSVFLINAGPIPADPLELLGSSRMTALIWGLRKQYDHILFDTPPLLAVTDGLVLGANLDGFIVVVWAERTSREALKRAKDKMDKAKIRPLGVVLNNVVIRRYDSYYKHQYYQSYGDRGEEKYGS